MNKAVAKGYISYDVGGDRGKVNYISEHISRERPMWRSAVSIKQGLQIEYFIKPLDNRVTL